ncbi:TaqI-like C-terminal specificity domain-containing protein, partial [Arthrospira platensis SPKY1]|nr:TaqI-like C-terminal specificity domain-containing protein [Arthrospira platensis SPKY1]
QLEPRPADWPGKPNEWPGRKPGSYKWYEIQDSVDYYEEFEKGKIMLPDIAIKAQCAYDESGTYCVNTAYIIPTAEYWLLGILNSSLVHFFYSNLTSSIRGGYLRFIRQYLEQIPIISDREELKAQIQQKVEAVLRSPSADTAALEAELDALVYGLYGLTEAEVA